MSPVSGDDTLSKQRAGPWPFLPIAHLWSSPRCSASQISLNSSASIHPCCHSPNSGCDHLLLQLLQEPLNWFSYFDACPPLIPIPQQGSVKSASLIKLFVPLLECLNSLQCSEKKTQAPWHGLPGSVWSGWAHIYSLTPHHALSFIPCSGPAVLNSGYTWKSPGKLLKIPKAGLHPRLINPEPLAVEPYTTAPEFL